MLEVKFDIDIDAPASEVWKRLAKLDDVYLWAETVNTSVYGGEQTEGVGARRVCEVQGFGTLDEKITQWDDGQSLTYVVDGMPKIVRHAQSHWRVEPITPEKTRVSVHSQLRTRYGVFGTFMAQTVMKPRVTKLLDDALRSFKEFVEQSHVPAVAPVELQAHVA